MTQTLTHLIGKKEYLEFFQDPDRFRAPSRDYNLALNYFTLAEEARKALIRILSKNLPQSPRFPLDLDVYSQFIITSHGEIEEIPSQPAKLLTGHSGPMMNCSGIELAKSQSTNASIVIAGDLPRAMEHALYKYAPETEERLRNISARVLTEIRTKRGIIHPETHLELVKLSLDHSIIPTPLVRAQFYGPMELLPEKGFDPAELDGTPLAEMLEPNQESLELVAKMSSQRSDTAFFATDENGRTLTESRPLFFHRACYFLNLFAPHGLFYAHISRRTINVVTSSGFVDVALAYHRHFVDPSRLVLEKAPKELTRGKEFFVPVDRDYMLLSDYKCVEPIKQETKKKAQGMLSRSLDDLVNQGEGIVDRALLERVKDGGRYKDQRVNARALCNVRSGAYLLLGQAGEGKSIFVADLARRIADGEIAPGTVPILVDLSQIKGVDFSKYIADLTPHQRRHERFVYILDGYDEMPGEFKGNCLEAVRNLSRDNVVFLSSRTTRFNQSENEGFRTLYLKKPETRRDYEKFLSDRDLEDRNGFITFINQYDDSVTGNYLLLSFLARLFSSGQVSADSRLTTADIYRRVVDHILGGHQYKKHKKPDHEEVEQRVALACEGLGRIAYEMVVDEREFSRDDLRPLGYQFSMDSELDMVNLLFRNEGGTYTFTHRTFMEYFCAREINRRLEAGEITIDEVWELASYGNFTRKIVIEGRNVNLEWEKILLFLNGELTTQYEIELQTHMMRGYTSNRDLSFERKIDFFSEEIEVAYRLAREKETFSPALSAQLRELDELESRTGLVSPVSGKMGYLSQICGNLLEQGDPNEVSCAIEILGELGKNNPQVIEQYGPKMIELFEGGRYGSTGAHASRVVAELSSRDTATLLEYTSRITPLLDQEDWGIVECAILALSTMAQYDPRIFDRYLPKLTEMLKDDYLLTRYDAVELVGPRNIPDLRIMNKCGSEIVALTEHRSEEVRQQVVVLLGDLGEENPSIVHEYGGSVVERLKDNCPAVRRVAARSLQRMGKHDASVVDLYCPRILDLLDDEDPEIVQSGLDALVELDEVHPEVGKRYINKIAESLMHPELSVRIAAAYAVTGVSKCDVTIAYRYLPNIVKLAKEPHQCPKILVSHDCPKIATAFVLGEMGKANPQIFDEYESTLRSLLLDEDPVVRMDTVRALGKIGQSPHRRSEVCTIIADCLTDESHYVVKSAAEALRGISNKDRTVAYKYAQRISELLEYPNEDIKCTAASTLAEFSKSDERLVDLYGARFFKLLITESEDGHYFLCSSVSLALRDMGYFDARLLDYTKRGNMHTRNILKSIKENLAPQGYRPAA